MYDDLVLINKGSVVLAGGVREIKSSFGKNTVIIEFDGDSGFLNNLNGIRINDKSSNRVEFKLEDPNLSTNDILQEAMRNNVKIIKFEKVEPSLHEIFIDVVGKENIKDANHEN
jgi:ABC-2 type transport system ATP-binding protein